MSPERHLTATGFVVQGDRVLLHWHRKNRLWLPFGGHIEANEDPVQTVLREIEEECGLQTELLVPARTLGVSNLPVVAAPVTILIEPTTDGVTQHEHIDLIYFCRPTGNLEALSEHPDPTIRWVDRAGLERNEPVSPLPGMAPEPVPADVRVLALAAMDQENVVSSEARRYL
ncbi:MAG: NUDIX hydrolase [Isosphaerales bacterium]